MHQIEENNQSKSKMLCKGGIRGCGLVGESRRKDRVYIERERGGGEEEKG